MPQPIDPNTELGRITAVERIQQIADRASLAAQHRTTLEAQSNVLNQETQVLQMHQKNEEVDAELKRRNPYAGRRRPGHPEDEDESATAAHSAAEREVIVDDTQATHLDVSI